MGGLIQSKKWLWVSVLSAMMLTACAGQYGHHGAHGPGGVHQLKKQHLGGLAGAIGGAIAGSNVGKGKGRIAAIAMGTLLGTAIGSEVGKSLDRADMMHMKRTSQRSFEMSPSGVTSDWVNPDTGNRGTITPSRAFKRHGSYCREFTQTITVGGQTQEGYGTACRKPDGSWEMKL